MTPEQLKQRRKERAVTIAAIKAEAEAEAARHCQLVHDMTVAILRVVIGRRNRTIGGKLKRLIGIS